MVVLLRLTTRDQAHPAEGLCVREGRMRVRGIERLELFCRGIRRRSEGSPAHYRRETIGMVSGILLQLCDPWTTALAAAIFFEVFLQQAALQPHTPATACPPKDSTTALVHRGTKAVVNRFHGIRRRRRHVTG